MSNYAGLIKSSGLGVHPWTHSKNPTQGNDWRIKAKGHRVLALMMWLYCDDTSGNLSKKWNKYNSFLWTPAGLPRHLAQKQYNVHFLLISNIAPPLEMMDGMVTQLEYVSVYLLLMFTHLVIVFRDAQRDGIWAWDIATQEYVLVFPVVLALLGDNPMQSEFACHIGLRGKFFCQACWVKGRDADNEVAAPITMPINADEAGEDADSDNHRDSLGKSSVDGGSIEGNSTSGLSAESSADADMVFPEAVAQLAQQSVGSTLSTLQGCAGAIVDRPPTKKKGCTLETLQQLCDRARHFLGVSSRQIL